MDGPACTYIPTHIGLPFSTHTHARRKHRRNHYLLHQQEETSRRGGIQPQDYVVYALPSRPSTSVPVPKLRTPSRILRYTHIYLSIYLFGNRVCYPKYICIP